MGLLGLVERAWCDFLIVPIVLLGLVDDPLKTVNQVFMVFIGIENVKAAQDELVLFSDESVEKFGVFFVFEMILRETIYELQKLLLVFWNWGHRSI